MAVDPDKAIEKLSQYREEAKNKKKLEFSSDPDRKTTQDETPLRQFFIQMYKFNAVVAASLAFVILLVRGDSYGAAIFWIFLSFFAFGISIQTMRTIERIETSDGRKTTIDDIFVVLLIIVGFFGYFPVLPVTTSQFRIIHVTLAILWLAQIFIVNYRKPEMSGYGRQGGIIEDTETESTMDKIKEFITMERLILLMISFIIALGIWFVQ